MTRRSILTLLALVGPRLLAAGSLHAQEPTETDSVPARELRLIVAIPLPDARARVGAQLFLPLGRSLSLDLSLRPDFSDVRADPPELGGTSFESYHEEMRPLFGRAAESLAFALGPEAADGSVEQLIYTRRIGSAPRWTSGAESWDQQPRAAETLSAAQLSGSIAGWEVYGLSALSGPVSIAGPEADGGSGQAYEPLAHTGAVRAGRELSSGRAGIGFLLASADRRVEAPSRYPVPAAARLFAADGRWEDESGRLRLQGWAAGSDVRGDSTSIALLQSRPGHTFQREDARHLRWTATARRLAGAAGALAAERDALGLAWSARGGFRSPGFEVNDLGFQREADRIDLRIGTALAREPESGLLASWSVGVSGARAWSFGGEQLPGAIELAAQLDGRSGSSAWIAAERRTDGLAPHYLLGGPAILTPASLGVRAGASVALGRGVHLEAGIERSSERDTGGRRSSMNAAGRYEGPAGSGVEVSAFLAHAVQPWEYLARGWVDSGDEPYVVARRDLRDAAVGARAWYTLPGGLTLEAQLEPYSGRGRHDRFRTLLDPRARSFAKRFSGPLDAAGDEEGELAIDRDSDGVDDLWLAGADYADGSLFTRLALRWRTPHASWDLVWVSDRSADDGSWARWSSSGTSALHAKASLPIRF